MKGTKISNVAAGSHPRRIGHIFAVFASYAGQDEGHNYLRSCIGGTQSGQAKAPGDTAPLTDTRRRRTDGPCHSGWARVFGHTGFGGHMRRVILPICLMLGACMPGTTADMPSRAATHDQSTMPAMKRFSAPRPVPPQRSNRDIQRDFLDLSFQLESGRPLQHFSRFEQPISIRVTPSEEAAQK